MSKQNTLVLQDLRKSFMQAGEELPILRGVNLTIAPGEVVALTGSSGAGKSTLLQIAGLLDTPTSGEIVIDGLACQNLGDDKRTFLRRHKIGFIYQFHHLLPEFTALENVMMPLMISGIHQKEARIQATNLLASLGLTSRSSHRPSQLSGGEQQRVAILRAFAGKPSLLLADEPTGNLDERTAALVFAELMDLARSHNMAALVATHSTALAARMDKTLRLHEGLLSSDDSVAQNEPRP
jgi:lipoprotein-releasing system ATP-binding protein